MASFRNNSSTSRPRSATRPDRSPSRAGTRGHASRTQTGRAETGVSAARRHRGAGAANSRQTNFMRYAADNRVVHAIYTFTTDFKPLFILLVVVAAGIGIYFPVRVFYIAKRTQDILEQQVAIRKTYNDALGKEVKQYLSQEGIEDAARKDLGMAMPGEKTITVEGLDKDGNPIVKQQDGTAGESSDGSASSSSTDGQTNTGASDGSQDGQTSDAAADGGDDAASSNGAAQEDSGKLKGADAADKSKTGSSTDNATDSGKEPSTSAEVEAAERAVLENAPWYWKLLDTIFFFDGTNGMAVVSTGDQASGSQSE